MATLFGHARGAFTGAVGEREGLLRQAHKGVAFLDEIGDLGLDEQAMLLRAIEDRRFRPMGSDREVESDFQLLAGTHRDLAARVAEGRFREDLLARIELWTFRLPGLRERPEDIEPNLDFELEASGRRLGVRASFNREARERFVAFAVSPEARWTSNFRDFSAAVTRLATLSRGGRIDMAAVEEEIARLRARWRAVRREEGSPAAVTPAATAVTAVTAVTAATAATDDDALVRAVLGAEGADALDRFDRPQLAEVIRVCRASPTLSAAGRELFARSRAGRTSFNDSDRLRKYLARLGLTWERVSRRTGGA
jgi:transcriptional regulatory protein RtcR